MISITIALLAFFVSIVLLVFLAYRGVTPMIIGPLVTIVLCLLSSMPPREMILGPYMKSSADYIMRFFLVFMTGAIFGRVMADTGAAQSIAQTIISHFGKSAAIPALVAATALLTYGGVSLFVVIFFSYPLALWLFKEANLPKKLIGGSVALGAFTFTMTGPGTPQIQNIIPMSYLGTDATAGLLPGIAGMAGIAILGTLYMIYRSKREGAKGNGFDAEEELSLHRISEEKVPNFWLSLLPPILVIILLNVFRMDVAVSVTAGIALAVIMFHKRLSLPSWFNSLNQGAISSAVVILNTALIVGYGGAVKLSPAFPVITDGLEALSGGNPYYFVAIATTIMAGICGSASGGLGVAFEAFGNKFLATGISPEAIHRIAAMASGGLDSLPHCGAVISLLTVAGLTHKESYLDIFMTTVVIPIISVFLIVVPLFMI
jgi:H+/gluconate symporter-like permease